MLLPKANIVFNMLFRDYENTGVLTDLIKSILGLSDNEYEGITNVSVNHERLSASIELALVGGKAVHVELQAIETGEIADLIAINNYKMLASQTGAGRGMEEFQRIVSIVIADFELIKGSQNYHHVFSMSDKTAGVMLTNIFEFHTLELHKVPAASDNTKIFDWLEVVKAKNTDKRQFS